MPPYFIVGLVSQIIESTVRFDTILWPNAEPMLLGISTVEILVQQTKHAFPALLPVFDPQMYFCTSRDGDGQRSPLPVAQLLDFALVTDPIWVGVAWNITPLSIYHTSIAPQDSQKRGFA